ncbi:unnamed protein product [Linum trigynum]|uniref:Uncharacterized protein n=1 Tax=Linum trigynum TaxID=586398 RepID=A0AAV2E9U9_9ROSI
MEKVEGGYRYWWKDEGIDCGESHRHLLSTLCCWKSRGRLLAIGTLRLSPKSNSDSQLPPASFILLTALIQPPPTVAPIPGKKFR